ncbi:hypothetical protein CYMTET_3898 [Cymbomonas tetramitiformis]|uniref:Uncharacterized protein n=1 Tax=Cymbomonas tetramitiformis TaxID=36881 RepID=A0AAE0LKY8_9CHLO|nr:hypothetical protein CYMTET_3898 [Cymbomonas tetramitiformis]
MSDAGHASFTDTRFRRVTRFLVYASFWAADFALMDHEIRCYPSKDAAVRAKLLRTWICVFMMRRIDEPKREVLCLMRGVYFYMSAYRSLGVLWEIFFFGRPSAPSSRGAFGL